MADIRSVVTQVTLSGPAQPPPADKRSVITRVVLESSADIRSVITRVVLDKDPGDKRSVITRVALESADASLPPIFYGGPSGWIPFRVYLPGTTWVRIV